MSICPDCGKRVKKASGDKIKIKGVWHHKSKCKRRKEWQKIQQAQ